MVIEEQFNFSSAIKRKVFTLIAIGAILAVIGVIGLKMHWWGGSHHASESGFGTTTLVADHHEGGHEAAAHGEATHSDAHSGGHGAHHDNPFKRVIAALWHNSVFYTGISILGIFFLAVQYVTWAGWSSGLKRVFESMGWGLFIGAPLLIIVLAVGGHDIFHWMHDGIMTKGSDNYDAIIAGKSWYLGQGFFWGRTLVYLAGWILLFLAIRKESLLEDKTGNIIHHKRQINWSAGFLVFFGVSSSMSAWDWIMSIDTHWFSTLFGWYVLMSLLVTAIAVSILIVIFLKGQNLLSVVNANHIHDLGKFLFGFSIFWAYLFFSQFILYWYSNIPEEVVYFLERMDYNDKVYAFLFILILFLNFVIPLLWLMTRDAKRHYAWLKVACYVVILGHWLDFYLMIYPGIMKAQGGIDLGFFFLEVGFGLLFAGLFIYLYLTGLSKAPVIAKNHPFLEESKHLHV